MRRILAIDYGTKRLGLAVSRASLAEPLRVIANDQSTMGQLLAILRDEQITQIVVGLSGQIMAEQTKQFVDELKKLTVLPISFTDENFSSQQVHGKLAAARTKLRRRRQPIDHLAAAEFLQEWLDSRI